MKPAWYEWMKAQDEAAKEEKKPLEYDERPAQNAGKFRVVVEDKPTPQNVISALIQNTRSVAMSNHGGYPSVGSSYVPPWWDQEDTGDVEDLNISWKEKKCFHKNTREVILFTSTLIECKDCGEEIK